MKFNFNAFETRVRNLLRDEDSEIVAEKIEIFRVYFEAYESYRNERHPWISDSQILRIAETMFKDYDFETYFDLIDKHFNTNYRDCDFNINHFFSGQIREFRLYDCYHP